MTKLLNLFRVYILRTSYKANFVKGLEQISNIRVSLLLTIEGYFQNESVEQDKAIGDTVSISNYLFRNRRVKSITVQRPWLHVDPEK